MQIGSGFLTKLEIEFTSLNRSNFRTIFHPLLPHTALLALIPTIMVSGTIMRTGDVDGNDLSEFESVLAD